MVPTISRLGAYRPSYLASNISENTELFILLHFSQADYILKIYIMPEIKQKRGSRLGEAREPITPPKGTEGLSISSFGGGHARTGRLRANPL